MLNRRFGAFAFHQDRRQLLRDGVDVHLSPKAFDLLALLIERAPAVVPKPEIHARLWPDTFVSDATLTGLVKELRRALNDEHQGTIVRTAHRVGFAFAVPADGPAPSGLDAVTCWVEAGSRRFPLHEGTNVIGRDPGSTISLDVAGVSRRHARIVLEPDAAWLDDLGSKNGTAVDDRRVHGRVALRDGDPIQVAGERLVFRSSRPGTSTATINERA
jgi:hypothetical protein